MPPHIKRIALIVSATLAAACSGTPRIAEPAANNATADATATSPAAAAAPTSDVDASLVKAGNTVQRRHDQVFYCRNEIITGNRIGTRVCLTAAQIQDEKQDATKAKDLMNKPNNRCSGPECVNH